MSDERENFVTIVSGLPRSGTSMMMQMLERGGLPVVTDGLRRADEDNPRGYYEFEAVKATAGDASWLETARGKGVKMIYRLLYDLPAGYSYRVVFMQRKLNEVLASQRAMLRRHGETEGPVDDGQMERLFRTELSRIRGWLADQPHFAVHEVSYNALLENPRSELQGVARFLGGSLDLDAMCAVIDASLYRNRA